MPLNERGGERQVDHAPVAAALGIGRSHRAHPDQRTRRGQALGLDARNAAHPVQQIHVEPGGRVVRRPGAARQLEGDHGRIAGIVAQARGRGRRGSHEHPGRGQEHHGDPQLDDHESLRRPVAATRRDPPPGQQTSQAAAGFADIRPGQEPQPQDDQGRDRDGQGQDARVRRHTLRRRALRPGGSEQRHAGRRHGKAERDPDCQQQTVLQQRAAQQAPARGTQRRADRGFVTARRGACPEQDPDVQAGDDDEQKAQGTQDAEQPGERIVLQSRRSEGAARPLGNAGAVDRVQEEARLESKRRQ
jgi:hypothetical protein